MPTDILLISRNFHPAIGGVETYITEFMKYFVKKQKGDLHILCPKRCSLPAGLKNARIHLYTPGLNFTFAEIDILLKGIQVWLQGFIFQIIIFIKGVSFLGRKKAGILGIYGVGGPFAIIPALILARLFGKKAYGHMHADFQFTRRSGLLKIFYRRLFNSLDRVFVNSRDVEIDLLNISVNKSKIVIISNWVDTQIFRLKDKRVCRQLFNFPEDKKVLLFVGRLSFEKGINEVLDCIDYFKDNKRYFFVIIGEGPLKGEVERRLRSNGNAIFLGPKRNFELVDCYNAADILLWGSIDTSYVSITIMEALHCGLPILAPRGTTNVSKKEIKKFEVKNEVIPDFLGLLFKSSAKELAEAIKKFTNLNFDRIRINQYATERYSDRNAERIFEEFYSER